MGCRPDSKAASQRATVVCQTTTHRHTGLAAQGAGKKRENGSKRQPDEYRRRPPTGQHETRRAAAGSGTGHDEMFGEYLQNHCICKWFEPNQLYRLNANSRTAATARRRTRWGTQPGARAVRPAGPASESSRAVFEPPRAHRASCRVGWYRLLSSELHGIKFVASGR